MKEVMECKTLDCTYNVFEESDYCILHCLKDNWREEKNGKLEWNMAFVNQFWSSFKAHVSYSTKCNYMTFPLNSYENQKSIFSNSIRNSLDLSSSTFLDSMQIRNTNILNNKFTNCKNLKLHISSSDIKNSSFNLFKDGNITFEFCNITECDFSENFGLSLLFDSCEKIDNCKFIKSDFSYLKFGVSNISNSVFYETKVREGCKNTFRIIKNFFVKISDNLNANVFHAKELRVIMNETCEIPINVVRGFFNNSKKVKNFFKYLGNFVSALNKCFSDGIILVWNYIVSYFGQNWVLPLFWFLISSIYFYIIIDVDGSRSLDEFSMFINPFLKNIDEKYKGFYTLWLVHKVLSVIFIYHFIVAVKRKTKK